MMMVISKEDQILIESLYETKGYGTRKLLNGFRRRKLDERRFRQFDYVLILFLIVTVNKFFKMKYQLLFSEVTVSCFRGL